MAQEIEVKSKRKKKSTRIDMTPLVDLGFLLVTFFILTSTYAKPQAMQLQLPNKNTIAKQPVFDSGTLTVLLGKDDEVFIRQGLTPKLVKSSFQALRQVFLEKQHQSKEKLFVIVKATHQAKYRNVVDVLDELKILNIHNFALVEVNLADKALLQQM